MLDDLIARIADDFENARLNDVCIYTVSQLESLIAGSPFQFERTLLSNERGPRTWHFRIYDDGRFVASLVRSDRWMFIFDAVTPREVILERRSVVR